MFGARRLERSLSCAGSIALSKLNEAGRLESCNVFVVVVVMSAVDIHKSSTKVGVMIKYIMVRHDFARFHLDWRPAG